MSLRPPRDAAVALRSLPRRFRGLFAALDEDESPDALARRTVSDGTSAIGHLIGASQVVADTHRALAEVLTVDDPLIEPIADETPLDPSGTIEERVSELGWETDALADRVDQVSADEWGRRARAGGGADAMSAVDLLWRGVDAAVAHLKGAERTLTEARQAR
jgi:hypothetical protein